MYVPYLSLRLSNGFLLKKKTHTHTHLIEGLGTRYWSNLCVSQGLGNERWIRHSLKYSEPQSLVGDECLNHSDKLWKPV